MKYYYIMLACTLIVYFFIFVKKRNKNIAKPLISVVCLTILAFMAVFLLSYGSKYYAEYKIKALKMQSDVLYEKREELDNLLREFAYYERQEEITEDEIEYIYDQIEQIQSTTAELETVTYKMQDEIKELDKETKIFAFFTGIVIPLIVGFKEEINKLCKKIRRKYRSYKRFKERKTSD